MPLSKFLDPRNDYSFKKIFGTEKNKDIIIHFINDILGFKGEQRIESVEFLKTFQDPDVASRKQSIVDLLCKDQKGRMLVVEMQIARTKGFAKRAQYYAAKAYISQMKRGEAYEDLKEVIFIAITDFVMFEGKEDYKSDHVILDKKTSEQDLKDFSFTFLELPKFNKSKDELENLVEKWTYFFKHADETKEEDLEAIIGQDFILQRAYDELNRFGWSEEELLTYEQNEKRIQDNKAALDYQLEKGRQEERLLIARNLLTQGLSRDQVCQVTGLTPPELKTLL